MLRVSQVTEASSAGSAIYLRAFQAINFAAFFSPLARTSKQNYFFIQLKLQLRCAVKHNSNPITINLLHLRISLSCYGNKYNMLQKIVPCWLWNLCNVWGRTWCIKFKLSELPNSKLFLLSIVERIYESFFKFLRQENLNSIQIFSYLKSEFTAKWNFFRIYVELTLDSYQITVKCLDNSISSAILEVWQQTVIKIAYLFLRWKLSFARVFIKIIAHHLSFH